MKFMKLGLKPDQFRSEGNNIRYVSADLATDLVVSVRDVKFYVHKFPLLSKSSRLQSLIANTTNNDVDEINADDIPGGPVAFETCAKFCYGMAVTLSAFNVIAVRCAAEYLEMHETVEKGNLVFKIDVFLTSSIFRSWKDSIIVLQTTKSFLHWLEGSKVVSHCIDSISTHASTNPERVDWPYTYSCKKKLPSDNGVRKKQTVPKDWWIEDLCNLPTDLYTRVITAIQVKQKLSSDIITEALRAYAVRKLPSFGHGGNCLKYRCVVETIIHLLPTDKGSVPCSFLLRLLSASVMFECEETGKRELIRRIAHQLDMATVSDFLTRSPAGGTMAYDIDVVQNLVEQFVMRERELPEMYREFHSDASKIKVARLVDGYLAEASRCPALPLHKFVQLAETVSGFPRLSHDGIYRAIDAYLKEHPTLTKSEKKRICRLIDWRRLSSAGSAHAVQNERLPLRVVVQVLFFEHARATAAVTGSSTPDVPSTATTNSDEEWDSKHIKNLSKSSTPRRMKKMLMRLLSSNSSSSDVSESSNNQLQELRRRK